MNRYQDKYRDNIIELEMEVCTILTNSVSSLSYVKSTKDYSKKSRMILGL